MDKYLRGEWWFIGETAFFCDGDTGDIDHIGMAIEHLYSEFITAIGRSKVAVMSQLHGVLPENFSDCSDIRSQLCDWSDLMCREGLLTEKQADDIHAFIRRQIRWTKEKYNMLISDEGDIRWWMMKHHGWIRAAGNRLELWAITSASLKQAADCIYDAQEGISPHAKFSIEERKTGCVYYMVPITAMEAAKPHLVRQFDKTKFNVVRS